MKIDCAKEGHYFLDPIEQYIKFAPMAIPPSYILGDKY